MTATHPDSLLGQRASLPLRSRRSATLPLAQRASLPLWLRLTGKAAFLAATYKMSIPDSIIHGQEYPRMADGENVAARPFCVMRMGRCVSRTRVMYAERLLRHSENGTTSSFGRQWRIGVLRTGGISPSEVTMSLSISIQFKPRYLLFAPTGCRVNNRRMNRKLDNV